MTGLDPATIANIRVYMGADAVEKAGPRATKGAVFLTTGYKQPDTGRAEFFLPNGEVMIFSRQPGKTGKMYSEMRVQQPGKEDFITFWNDENPMRWKFENGQEDAFTDALTLRPAFFRALLAHYASLPGPAQPGR
jgi:hypothetical protein